MKVSLNARSNQEALEQLRDVKEKLLQFNSLEPVVNRLDQFFFSLQQIINSLYTQDSFADIASILDFLLVALTIADFDVLPYWESLVDPLVALVKINELKSTAESVLCRISRDSLAKAEILSKLRHKQQYTQDRQLIDDINGMILRIDRVTPKSYPHRALRRTSSLNYSSSDTYDSASPVSKEAELDLHSENSASNVDQRVLSISILPHSLKENWMLTTDEEEVRVVHRS